MIQNNDERVNLIEKMSGGGQFEKRREKDESQWQDEKKNEELKKEAGEGVRRKVQDD